jgi:hypothetical protein
MPQRKRELRVFSQKISPFEKPITGRKLKRSKQEKVMDFDNIRKTIIHSRLVLLLLIFFLVACHNNGNLSASATEIANPTTMSTNEVHVIITGGHNTDPRDGGRPVVLIASALGVPPEVFREAFSHVHPAAAGSEPDSMQVRLNKATLLNVLTPYGITIDFLDTVSNYYRFNGNAGETWPQTPAAATTIVADGVITGFVVTHPGSGYTSPPDITISGSNALATATISFSKDFNTNGSLKEIVLKP